MHVLKWCLLHKARCTATVDGGDQIMMEPADRGAASSDLTAALLSRRSHGSLDAITDSERRALRPIGVTTRELATRTKTSLVELLAQPGVQIFHGVRQAIIGAPCIPHVVSAGRALVLIESVAWPSGHYELTPGGRITCDGVYIGQSVAPLMVAVRYWQEILPGGHAVRAAIVVYPACPRSPMLPKSSAAHLSLATASDFVSDLRKFLPAQPQSASWPALAALLAATMSTDDR